MRKITEINPSRPGLARHDPARRVLIQSRIECQFFGDVFGLMDIPPWGTILPILGATEPGIFYFFVVEVLGMPKDTVLGIRWAPRNGNNAHVLSHVLPGDDKPTARLEIPDAWVLECEDQDVLIEVEVSYPDGSTEVGRSFEIHVSKHLTSNSLTIADLQHNDNLDPANYPEGIAVTIHPITNVEPYNRVFFSWQVHAQRENGSISTLHEWEEVQTGEPGKAYEFFVPPEAYTGYGAPHFTRYWVSAVGTVKLAPWPTPQFIWVIGGADLNLPFAPVK